MEDRIFYVDVDGIEDGIKFISLVERPAIEANYMLFNKQIKFSADDNQHCLTGPILIPDQKIYRRDAKGEYYIVFTAETIERIAAKMISQGTAANVDTEHNKQKEDGIVPIEVYLKDSKRNNLVGFEDLPDKTLFVTYKVYDDDLYERIKTDFKGFSIEALLDIKPKEDDEVEDILKMLNKIKRVK